MEYNKTLNMGLFLEENPWWVPFSAKMTLKNGYGFQGFSCTPPSEPNLSTPGANDPPWG